MAGFGESESPVGVGRRPAEGFAAESLSIYSAEAPDAVAPGSRKARQLVQGWLCFAHQPFTKKHALSERKDGAHES